jgi:hypothetical protein
MATTSSASSLESRLSVKTIACRFNDGKATGVGKRTTLIFASGFAR